MNEVNKFTKYTLGHIQMHILYSIYDNIQNSLFQHICKFIQSIHSFFLISRRKKSSAMILCLSNNNNKSCLCVREGGMGDFFDIFH